MTQALKGRNNLLGRRLLRPFRARKLGSAFDPQGVALGWFVAAPSGPIVDREHRWERRHKVRELAIVLKPTWSYTEPSRRPTDLRPSSSLAVELRGVLGCNDPSVVRIGSGWELEEPVCPRQVVEALFGRDH